MRASTRKKVEKSSLSVFLLFSSYILISVLVNSSDRNSLLSASTVKESDAYYAGVGEETEASSKVRLQNFHRTEIKDGRSVWEVTADDAKYFGRREVTHLENSILTLYQEDGREVVIHSDSAKLSLKEQSLNRAQLAGNIRIEIDKDISIITPSALYKVDSNEVTSAEQVGVSGTGFHIEGKDLRAKLDSEQIYLYSDVRSVFQPGLRGSKKASKGLSSLVGGKSAK